MALLRDIYFAKPCNLPIATANQLLVHLCNNGWDRSSPVARVNLWLSENQQSVQGGKNWLAGPLIQDNLIVEAHKLWEQADRELRVSFGHCF